MRRTLLPLLVLLLLVPSSATASHTSSGTWFEGAPLGQARWQHTATLLSNGKVLVAGGSHEFSDESDSAELWDPNTEEWQATGPMTAQRYDHDAIRLDNGTVLVFSDGTAELYLPGTRGLEHHRRHGRERLDATATRLPTVGSSSSGTPPTSTRMSPAARRPPRSTIPRRARGRRRTRR